MAYEFRRVLNGVYGQLAAPGITAAATSIVDAGLANLPTIAGTQIGPEYIPIALTDSTQKLTEIVYVTAHAAGSSTVTIERAKESTTARAWPGGTQWAQADTRWDGVADELSTTLPTSPFVGQHVVERDTGQQKRHTRTAGWQAAVGVALPTQVGVTRAGSAPPADAAMTVRASHATVTTNAVGDANVPFSTAFPNGCVSVSAVSADYTMFGGTVNVWAEGPSGFDFRAMVPGGSGGVVAVVNSTFKIQYIAVGW